PEERDENIELNDLRNPPPPLLDVKAFPNLFTNLPPSPLPLNILPSPLSHLPPLPLPLNMDAMPVRRSPKLVWLPRDESPTLPTPNRLPNMLAALSAACWAIIFMISLRNSWYICLNTFFPSENDVSKARLKASPKSLAKRSMRS